MTEINEMIRERIEVYFDNLGFYKGMTPSNKEAAQDRLMGYLDAYIERGILTKEQADEIFKRLTYEEPFTFRDPHKV
jgi:hypothetical protein